MSYVTMERRDYVRICVPVLVRIQTELQLRMTLIKVRNKYVFVAGVVKVYGLQLAFIWYKHAANWTSGKEISLNLRISTITSKILVCINNLGGLKSFRRSVLPPSSG